MRSMELFDKFEGVWDYFVKWGFVVYLLSRILKVIMIFPFLFFFIFWSLFNDEYQRYQKKKQALAKEND